MKKMVIYLLLLMLAACHKKSTTPGPLVPPVDTTVNTPTDPPLANTIGFFPRRLGTKKFYRACL